MASAICYLLFALALRLVDKIPGMCAGWVGMETRYSGQEATPGSI